MLTFDEVFSGFSPAETDKKSTFTRNELLGSFIIEVAAASAVPLMKDILRETKLHWP